MADEVTANQAAVLRAAGKNLTRGQKDALKKATLDGQIVRKQESFWSQVRFQYSVTPAALVTTMAIASGLTVAAFSYGLNDALSTNAGFAAAFGNATEAETNLLQKYDTGGRTVAIYGLSLYLGELSEPELVKQIFANTVADITLNGADRFTLLGKLGKIPAAGGLYGRGDSYAKAPDFQSNSATSGVLTNGVPMQDNFYRLNETIIWYPNNKAESKFQMRFKVQRALSYVSTGRALVADVASTTSSEPETAFAAPQTAGDLGSFVDLTVYLNTISTIPRSTQA